MRLESAHPPPDRNVEFTNVWQDTTVLVQCAKKVPFFPTTKDNGFKKKTIVPKEQTSKIVPKEQTSKTVGHTISEDRSCTLRKKKMNLLLAWLITA